MAAMLLIGSTVTANAALRYSTSTRIYACVNKTTKVARIVVPKNGHTACRRTETLSHCPSPEPADPPVRAA